MSPSKLKINDGKTECLVVGTRQELAKVSVNRVAVGEKSIIPSRK